MYISSHLQKQFSIQHPEGPRRIQRSFQTVRSYYLLNGHSVRKMQRKEDGRQREYRLFPVGASY